MMAQCKEKGKFFARGTSEDGISENQDGVFLLESMGLVEQ